MEEAFATHIRQYEADLWGEGSWHEVCTQSICGPVGAYRPQGPVLAIPVLEDRDPAGPPATDNPPPLSLELNGIEKVWYPLK